MSEEKNVLAVIGSYRIGGIVDQAIDEILSSAEESGARTKKIFLKDQRIEFCRNCRACTQAPGKQRGQCVIEDDMNNILDEIEKANAIVLGSPMNFGTVTAVMKVFVERLVCFAWWPWGKGTPKVRDDIKTKRAVIVVSSAAPSFLARVSSKMVKLLKDSAGLLGARTVGTLYIGLAAMDKGQQISVRTTQKAGSLGKRLVKS